MTTSKEIVANGQTIVYTLHHSIGHLGIFVSGKVATKEHREFVSCMDMIDVAAARPLRGGHHRGRRGHGEPRSRRWQIPLPPGGAHTRRHPRASGVNSAEDDKRFAAVARVSEINLGLYRTLAEPWRSRGVTEPMAEAMRAMHPHRLRFGLFSDQNPFMQPIKPLAEMVRANRRPVSEDNPLLAMEKAASSWITTCLRKLQARSATA